MRIFYSLGFICLFLIQGERSSCQSLSLTFPDTLVYGEPVAGSNLSCWVGNWVKNISGAPLTVDVIRVMDDTSTPGWTSSFCFYFCQMPTIDSFRYTMPKNDSVNMAVHLIITANPDSGTVIMKIKNASDPSEFYIQRFHGVSEFGAGVNESGKSTQVSIYPSPVISGNALSMNLANIKSTDILFVLYDVYGSVIKTIGDLKEGNNNLSLNLAAGIYSYSLLSGNTRVNSGKFSVVK